LLKKDTIQNKVQSSLTQKKFLDALIWNILLTVVRAPVKAPPEEYLISPITGEKIPASKVQEHMRIGLLDPRWVEQRDKHISDKMNQESVYAPGNISDNHIFN